MFGQGRRLFTAASATVMATGALAAAFAMAAPSTTVNACSMSIQPLNPFLQTCGIPNQPPAAVGGSPGAGAIIACRDHPGCLSYVVNGGPGVGYQRPEFHDQPQPLIGSSRERATSPSVAPQTQTRHTSHVRGVTAVEKSGAPTDPDVRTAIVFVHGKGETEYRPNETLDGFVKTALHPLGDANWAYYYSQPDERTGSYEARVYVAPPLDEPKQGRTDVYEYHWQYMMTGTRFAGTILTTLRVFLRRPSNVPDSLFGIWRALWLLVLGTICLVVPILAVLGYFLGTEFPIWVVGLVASVFLLGGVGFITQVLSVLLYSPLTTSFIDVARYLDPWMRSYAARRAIRGGLVDLVHDLHDEGRYTRIIVVAHGVGTYIAYDALTGTLGRVSRTECRTV